MKRKEHEVQKEEFGREATIGDLYGPAMKMTRQDEADSYFEKLVERSVRLFGTPRAEAESIEKSNLGYYAGYYDHDTRMRVERLFRCTHPVVGSAEKGSLSPEAAFAAGVAFAASVKS